MDRAISLASRSPRDRERGALPALGLLLLALSGCDGATSNAAVPSASAGRPDVMTERDIGDLVAAFTPPIESSTSTVKDDWLRRRRAVLERMKQGDKVFGKHLLDAFLTREGDPLPVRSGLLEAASYANPEAAAPILIDLVRDYGEDLGLRTDACRFLGTAAPEQAIEVLGELLFAPQRSSTSPGDEALLTGWLEAHRCLDRDPGRKLADLATDIRRDQATRHMAIRALGEHPSKLSLKALEEVLHESSGDAYMRRLAAQSMVRIGEREEICPIFVRVFESEADINFQLFLESMIDEHCQ